MMYLLLVFLDNEIIKTDQLKSFPILAAAASVILPLSPSSSLSGIVAYKLRDVKKISQFEPRLLKGLVDFQNLRDFKVNVVDSNVKDEHRESRKLGTNTKAHHFLSPSWILVLE